PSRFVAGISGAHAFRRAISRAPDSASRSGCFGRLHVIRLFEAKAPPRRVARLRHEQPAALHSYNLDGRGEIWDRGFSDASQSTPAQLGTIQIGVIPLSH